VVPVRVKFDVPFPVRCAYAVDVSLIAMCLFSRFVWNPSTLLNEMVSVYHESSLPTWYSSVKLFVIAALILAVAFSRAPGRAMLGKPLTYFGLVVLFMSMDEIAQVHERFSAWTDQFLPGSERLLTPLPNSGLWPILVIPFLAVVVPLMIRLYKDQSLSRRAIRLLGTGLLILLAGAVGLELLANLFVYEGTLHLVENFIEESLEMFGASTMLWGAIELYRSEGLPEAPSVRQAKASTSQ